MLRNFSILLILFFIYSNSHGQTWERIDTNEVSFLFAGDVMGHGPQIRSAYNVKTKCYDYSKVFQHIKTEISAADFAIANLEVTLAGPPFKGYPQFSSPDALVTGCKNAGFDCLVTANNHSCDRGKKGILRTIKILDSFNIKHTGTFINAKEKEEKYPIILEKNNIRVALLNYTYGTNGIRVPKPTIVNLIDTNILKKDLEKAKNKKVDKIIVAIHWGFEYQSNPHKEQKDIADFILKNGADIIIGGHPHVIQKAIWKKATQKEKENFVAYSLVNFVSNQRKTKTDGGMMIKITLMKVGNKTKIKSSGYYLTWVHTLFENNKREYYILPCNKFENNKDFFTSELYFNKMKLYINNSRKLLNKQNINVEEIK